jgi:hypothetical protein
MAGNDEDLCFKCGGRTGKLMRCKACGTCFCDKCFPPLTLDSGVIADRINMCPKCDGRVLEYLK